MAILTQALSGLVFCMTLRAFQQIRIVRRMMYILLEGVGLELIASIPPWQPMHVLLSGVSNVLPAVV